MSTGLGTKGKVSRCFAFAEDFGLCMKSSTDIANCKNLRDDFLECLHAPKLHQRAAQIKEQEAANKDGHSGHGHGHGGGHH